MSWRYSPPYPGSRDPQSLETIPVAEHFLSFVQEPDLAFQLCSFGIAAPGKFTKQTADEQTQRAAINIDSQLFQQLDNMDPQPTVMQKLL